MVLQAGADATLTNANGEKPYDCARLEAIKEYAKVQCNHSYCLTTYRLLATGANKLHYNASHGNEQEICRLIEEDEIPIDVESYHGNTALHEASRCGHLGLVQQLIKFGANINKKNGKTGSTPLHLASAANHVTVVQVLLAAGAKRDVKDKEGKVPFEVAHSHEMRKALMKQFKTSHDLPTLPRPSLTANL